MQQNDSYVSELAEALRSQVNLSAVPGLLKQVIKHDMWRKRIVKQTKQPVEYQRFTDFVSDFPPEGLGTNMNVLMSLCRFHNDIEAVDLLASVTGDQGNPTGNNQYSGNHNNVMVSSPGAKQGNSAAYTLRRLSKDFPAIHDRVLAGELSPHRAAIEAGFRQRTFQVPTDAEAAAAYLAKRVDEEWMLTCCNLFLELSEQVEK